MQTQIACTETALILKVYGDGSVVLVGYVRASFEDERLPRDEDKKVGVLESTIDGTG